MKRKMLSKYGVALTKVENHEGQMEERLVLGKRTLEPLALTLYAPGGFILSLVVSSATAASAEHFLHATAGAQLSSWISTFILCALGFTAWLIARHNFQDFTSARSELFYYKKVYNENLESPGNQLMLGMLAGDGEFEYGVAQISKEHNKFIEATLLPGSPGVIEAEEQEIRRADVERAATFNGYMNKLLKENGGSYGIATD